MELPHREAGTRLYLLRRKLGISVPELSRNLGCTPSLIYSWECGREMPSALHLRSLARALRVRVEDLLGWPAAV